jgi:hypothetical protein
MLRIPRRRAAAAARHTRVPAPQTPSSLGELLLGPTELHAGYAYQPGSIEDLRRHAENLRADAQEADAQAVDAFSRAAHLRQRAADFDRLASLAYTDLVGAVPDGYLATPAPVPGAAQQPRHFVDGPGFWPACGSREAAQLATSDPDDVTCPGCFSELARFTPWAPSSEADAAGSSDRAADTLTMSAVNGAQR